MAGAQGNVQLVAGHLAQVGQDAGISGQPPEGLLARGQASREYSILAAAASSPARPRPLAGKPFILLRYPGAVIWQARETAAPSTARSGSAGAGASPAAAFHCVQVRSLSRRSGSMACTDPPRRHVREAVLYL